MVLVCKREATQYKQTIDANIDINVVQIFGFVQGCTAMLSVLNCVMLKLNDYTKGMRQEFFNIEILD